MGNTVRFKAQLDDQVSGKLGKIRDNFDRLGKSKGAQSIIQGVGMGMGISAWGMLDRAISGAVNVMADAVQGAIEEQKSIARLTTSLKANVAGWDGRTKALEEVFAAQLKLGFSDEEQRDSMSLLVAATGDVAEALKIQRTAMDLARFKGISLAEATDALTKVEAGSYRILKSLGIELKKGATQTEALAAVQKIATGQAEDYADTVEGKALVATIRFDEKMEELGSKTLPLVEGALDGVINLLDLLGNEGEGTIPVLAANTAEFQKLEGALAVATARYRAFVPEVVGAIDPVEKIGAGIRRVRGEAKKTTPPLDEVADSLKDIEQSAKDALVALGLFKWEPAELKGNFAEAQGAVREAKIELNKFKEKLGDDKPTQAQQRQLDILNGKLAETQQAAYEAEIAMLAVDGLTFEEAIAAVNKYGIKVDWLGDKWLRVLRLATRVNNEGYLDPGVGGTGGTQGARASGGPVTPFGVYSVGEQGPETLVMGARGGFVIPNTGGADGGGAPVTINVQLDGRTIAEVVDRHLYYKAARAPRTAYAG